MANVQRSNLGGDMTGVARVYSPPATQDPGDFMLLSIVAVDTPAGCTGTNWRHYRIGQGKNVIEGYRRGTANSVREHVETVILALNERRTIKRGRVGLTSPAHSRVAAVKKNDA
jgi:hypothetical protein